MGTDERRRRWWDGAIGMKNHMGIGIDEQTNDLEPRTAGDMTEGKVNGNGAGTRRTYLALDRFDFHARARCSPYYLFSLESKSVKMNEEEYQSVDVGNQCKIWNAIEFNGSKELFRRKGELDW
jgi:hypothetical protein